MGFFSLTPDVNKLERKKDIIGLVDALGYKNKKSPFIYIEAKSALIRIGEPALVSFMEAVVKAVECCYIPEESLSEFYSRVTDVLWGMLSSKGEAAVKPLLNIARISGYTQHIIIEVLKKLGKQAVNPLIQFIQNVDDDPSYRGVKWAIRVALRSLGEIGDNRAIGPIIEFLCSDKMGSYDYGSNSLRLSIVYALYHIDAKKSIDTLEAIFNKERKKSKKTGKRMFEDKGDRFLVRLHQTVVDLNGLVEGKKHLAEFT